jgi:hypothetical protein
MFWFSYLIYSQIWLKSSYGQNHQFGWHHNPKAKQKGYKSQGHQACGNWVMKSILDVQAHVTHDWEIEACRPHLSFLVDSTSFFWMITSPWSNQDVSLLVHFSGEISVTPLYFFSMYNNAVKFSWRSGQGR